MRITRYGEHQFQLTRYASIFPMNCFLVREDDGLTLIDSTIFSPADDVARMAAAFSAPSRRSLVVRIGAPTPPEPTAYHERSR